MESSGKSYSLRWRRLWPWGVLLVLAGLALYRLKWAPVPAEYFAVQTGPVVAEVMGTGTLEARLQATISPKIQGLLTAVLADQNDRVQTGQTLARLDDAELRRAVEVAEANLAAARAGSDRVRSEQARAEAVLKQAQLDHQRATQLATSEVAAQAELDKALEQRHVAEADLSRVQAAIIEAGQQILAAEKNLALQRERLANAEITAPFAGLVVRRDRDPGDVVAPGGSILQLIALEELWISAWVDETAMAQLAPEQPARIVFRSEPDRPYPGQIARLGREADRETREFLVDVRLAELPKNWAVGQRAEVYLETSRNPATLPIPQRLVRWRQGQAAVLVNDGGKVRWRNVTLGLRGREVVEVRAGLQAGDQLVQPARGWQPEQVVGRRLRQL